MGNDRPIGVKCTPEECRRIAGKVQTVYPILDDREAMTERARLFQALGNETRLQILALLSMQEMCVCNLVAALGGAASTVAHHLRMLEDAGLVKARQEGKFTLYELNDAPLRQHRVFSE